MKNLNLTFFTLLMILTLSCNEDAVVNQNFQSIEVAEYDYKVIYDWNQVILNIDIDAEGFRYGPSNRVLAYTGLAAYEGVVQGMPAFNSFDRYWKGFEIPEFDAQKEYCWPIVVNATYEYLLPKFFGNAQPDDLVLIVSTAKNINDKYRSIISDEVFKNSINWGKSVAESVWNYAQTDAIGHEQYLNPYKNYDWQQSFIKEGDWQPTYPNFELPIGGEWGSARTFGLKENDKICHHPLQYGTDSFGQCVEVVAQTPVYPNFDPNLDYNLLYSNDEFVGFTFGFGLRFLSIGNQALKIKNSNLSDAVYMNALLGLVTNDASVACWHSKYYFNIENPVTYIRSKIDADWIPAMFNPITKQKGITPSYPSYPSGHSTLHAAGSEVLSLIFGNTFMISDLSHAENPLLSDIRPMMSIRELALSYAWERNQLGIDLRRDIEEGFRFGTDISRKIIKLPWKKQ